MLTQERLKEVLTYNPDTGEFIWNIRGTGMRMEGKVAGSIADGYRYIRVDTKSYLDGRLAFLYMTGSFPKDGKEVDHRDTKPLNCKWDNIRPATRAQNQHNQGLACNNTSGIKGVYLHKTTGKWMASLFDKGKHLYLGIYQSKEAAAYVVKAKRAELHGEFANHANCGLPILDDLL